jgi:hypothetical protein
MGWKEDREKILGERRVTATPKDQCGWCGAKLSDGSSTLCPPCDAEARAEDAKYAAQIVAEENANPWDGCCTLGKPCPDHFDDMYGDRMIEAADRYGEYGIGRGAR